MRFFAKKWSFSLDENKNGAKCVFFCGLFFLWKWHDFRRNFTIPPAHLTACEIPRMRKLLPTTEPCTPDGVLAN